MLAEAGDDAPIDWLGRERRFEEKLATPDVTMADLIGDIDPIKAATERRTYADPEIIHFGIIPRMNRGIFAINELPDLQPRIQVGLLNLMQEKDIQIRGFPCGCRWTSSWSTPRTPRTTRTAATSSRR